MTPDAPTEAANTPPVALPPESNDPILAAKPPETKPADKAPDQAKAEAKTKPKDKPNKPKNPNVSLAILATVIIVLGLAVLAVAAYLKK